MTVDPNNMCTATFFKPLQSRFADFIAEAKQFVHLVETSDLNGIKKHIDSCRHLFRGACGVRHVDFIAYKDN